MKIVARVHLYPPTHCAGAERMLHELLKALVQRGHDVTVHLSRAMPVQVPYKIDGVTIVPRTRTDHGTDWLDDAEKADVLLTHLDNTSTVIRAAIALRKPLVQVLHNTHAPTRMWANCRNDLLVYNSHDMRVELGDDPNGIVVHPPVRIADYGVDRPGEPMLQGKVTLINLNQAKGGLLFAMLAATMPEVQFLGVHGAYGEQLVPDLPNVEILPHGTNMKDVYRTTAVLLMPSSYESYGRVGVEAMCSGIPVIANGHPGVREALGDAGIYMTPDDTLADWQFKIRHLRDCSDAYSLCSELASIRAAQLDPTDELAAFCDRVEAL